MKSLVLFLITLTFAYRASGAVVDFQPLPGGDRMAAPGSTAGWGYTLTNNSPDEWLVPMSLSADSFLNGHPTTLFDFPILSPGASVSVEFDPALLVGLYMVTVAPDAPVGFVEQGLFTLGAEWWSDDPAGVGAPLGETIEITAPWSIEIAGVPEPAYTAPLCIVVSGLFWIRRKRLLSIGRNSNDRN